MKNTKGLVAGGGSLERRSTSLVATLVCLLLPIYFLYVMRTDRVTRSIVNSQVLPSTGGAAGHEKVLQAEGHKGRNKEEEEGKETALSRGVGIRCDFSEVRYDMCEVDGDVRVHGGSSSIVLVSSDDQTAPIKIRPYPRKWENLTMQLTTELTVSSAAAAGGLQCDVRYSAPAVVFSTGGFRENFFHEIVDVLIPLFHTSHRFAGDVHLLVEDYRPEWIAKYGPAVDLLTRHEIVNLDEDRRVHCFPHATVGLQSTMEMGIDRSKSPSGPSMLDFRALLRKGFRLPREFVVGNQSRNARRKPRLLFLSRKRSRVLVNEAEVLRMVRRLGYKVVTASPEQTRNLSSMARLANSCDVLLGVHGAGLTNMLFLPANATMVQIIPWGQMLYPCRFSYGDPAIGMGLRYIDYEIEIKETSLLEQYPKDHAVFTDPLSIHKQGFAAIWKVFLHQDITLDVPRFREFLSREIGFW